MTDYYAQKLSAERLEHVYEIASLRLRQYLDAEAEYVTSHLKPGDRLLELGCGYGRLLPGWVERCATVVGVDSSLESLRYGLEKDLPDAGLHLLAMDAGQLGFPDETFDVVACVQNGISAFKVEPAHLIREALRVTRPGGIALFSSYAEEFWPERLAWFRAQAEEGLLGPLDEQRTGNGVIVCSDGFTATTFTRGDFIHLTSGLNANVLIEEVDSSSLFCVIRKSS
ncbi:MAG: class I SAM-dependent methyltransferase [bacterium]